MGANQTVRIRSGSTADEGRWAISLVIPEAHERSIYSVSWTKTPESATFGDSESASRSRGWIATGGGDGHIKVWQIEVGI